MNPIKNAWYVAALAKNVSTTPIKQKLLDCPIVLYRTESGEAVALDDRCPHRFAPLHKGKVVGDSIECPYHGLQFSPDGVCSRNPHGDCKIPAAAKVRRYPLREQDGLIWLWCGEVDVVGSPLSLGEFFDADHRTLISGYYKLNAHIEIVLDNLMDLSHAPFLHPTTLADASNTESLIFEMKQEGDAVIAYHWIPNARVSPQFRPFWPSDVADNRANITWTPPANLQLDVGVTEVGGRPGDGVDLHFAHLLSPAGANETHYFWIAARNYEIGNEEVSRIMEGQVEQAFETEDEPMIEAVAGYMSTPDLLALKPVLLPGDAAAIRVRRMLQLLREKE
ncbi:MAG: aromatic ring-hydroxylating dioxygenase subunit alpha [Rhodocyclaceae bacterium]|nr:MAG: aromatic ring-hydroxylating dioxygenase subunit alpha [Rhodocyclaceae bacterium]